MPASRSTRAGPELRRGDLRSLPRRTYRFRVLGMGLAGLAFGSVLYENHAPWSSWAWLVFSCLLWPHLAYAIAVRSKDPLLAELRNFMVDSMFAGSWVPLMQFNVLPSVVLITVVTADKINSGIRDLWLRSLPGLAAALLGVGLLTGFALKPQTSMLVLLACLPMLVVHTMAVALGSYKLVRRVQRQNHHLEALSRVDALTGLDSRRHWESQAEALLHRHHGDGHDASLMLVDVDRFKDINDRYGHSAGDDVLRGIAELIRRGMWADSHAGRLGGDEFAVALSVDMGEAASSAEHIRAAVERLDFPRYPGLRCSISIGLAPAPDDAQLGLREWLEAADRALYGAKHAGRNRTVGRDTLFEAGN